MAPAVSYTGDTRSRSHAASEAATIKTAYSFALSLT
jgi:hypothetical protein